MAAEWKRFLIAVDETETSMRAVRYAGELVGPHQDIEILLIHVYPEPQPDYYRKGGTLRAYQEDKEASAGILFGNVRNILEKKGISGNAIAVKAVMAEGKTLSQAIIDEQKSGGFGTVILGKRGLSKAEEFLFGSISSALLHKTRDCAVIAVG